MNQIFEPKHLLPDVSMSQGTDPKKKTLQTICFFCDVVMSLVMNSFHINPHLEAVDVNCSFLLIQKKNYLIKLFRKFLNRSLGIMANSS